MKRVNLLAILAVLVICETIGIGVIIASQEETLKSFLQGLSLGLKPSYVIFIVGLLASVLVSYAAYVAREDYTPEL